MIVFPGCLWFRMSIPSALPGLVFRDLEIVDCVVASDKPPDVDPNLMYYRGILCFV